MKAITKAIHSEKCTSSRNSAFCALMLCNINRIFFYRDGPWEPQKLIDFLSIIRNKNLCVHSVYKICMIMCVRVCLLLRAISGCQAEIKHWLIGDISLFHFCVVPGLAFRLCVCVCVLCCGNCVLIALRQTVECYANCCKSAVALAVVNQFCIYIWVVQAVLVTGHNSTQFQKKVYFIKN